MKMTREDPENGQVLIIFALLLFSVVLGAAAIAIDLGNGYLQQRRLQNITDAAALGAASEIARGGNDTNARQAARDIVLNNTGNALTLPFPSDPGFAGTGSGLRNGIEINGTEVRVALTRQVNSFLAQVLGITNFPVIGRSRVSNTASGAFLPIAMKRFSTGDTSRPFSEAGTVYDAVAPTDTGLGLNPLSGWPSPLSRPAPVAPQFTDWTALNPTSSASGPVVAILGGDAGSNVGSPDYHFWIAPDVRNIWPGPAQYFNKITAGTNVQTLKDLSQKYILSKGYTGPLPHIGDQIATLNGSDVGLSVAALRQTFRNGEVVSALVYDGTLYQTPDFSVSATPSFNDNTPNKDPNQGKINYLVTVSPASGFNGSITLRAYGLETPNPPATTPPAPYWGQWSFSSGVSGTTCNGSTNTACTVPIASWSGSATATFTAKPYGGADAIPASPTDPGVPAIPPASGEKSVLIVASYDTGIAETNLVRVATVKAKADPGPGTFSVASPQATVDIQIGSGKTVDLKLFDNGYSSNVKIDDSNIRAMLYDPSAAPANLSFGGPPAGVTFSPKNPKNKSPNATGSSTLQMDINVSTSASATTAPTGWLVKVPVVSTAGSTPNQDFFIFLRILPTLPAGNTVGNITSFVYVLGYADFVLSYAYDQSGVAPAGDSSILTKNSSMDSNTIYAYAVSGLYDPYDPLTLPTRKLGSRPRLVPW